MYQSKNSNGSKFGNYDKYNIEDEQETAKRILELLEKTKYKMIQENGQRIYGGPCPGWDPNKPPPPRSCEIFIVNIPRKCFEDVLVPIFSTVGEIYELRLMLDFDGGHRGFAFLKYKNEFDAIRAIQTFDKFKIEGNKKLLRVYPSRNHSELEVVNIYVTDTIFAKIDKIVRERTSGLKALYRKSNHKIIIEYNTHRDAAIARRYLLGNITTIFGSEDVRIQLKKPNHYSENFMTQDQKYTSVPLPQQQKQNHYDNQFAWANCNADPWAKSKPKFVKRKVPFPETLLQGGNVYNTPSSSSSTSTVSSPSQYQQYNFFSSPIDPFLPDTFM